MGALDFLFGKKAKDEKRELFSPEQTQLLDQLRGGAGAQVPQMFQFLQQLLSQDPEQMKAFEAPARRQFEEQTLPTIAERFTGMDAQKSSAFGQQLGQAGAGLEEQLSAQRSGLGMTALQQLMSMLGTGLTQQTENIHRPQTFGLLGELLKGAVGGGSALLGAGAANKLLPMLGLGLGGGKQAAPAEADRAAGASSPSPQRNLWNLLAPVVGGGAGALIGG